MTKNEALERKAENARELGLDYELLEAKDEPWEKFCDSNCVWTDHHPDCKLAKDEPVAWYLQGLNQRGVSLKKETQEWKPLYTTPLQQEAKDEPVAWMCADESLINKGYARFSHVCMGEWKIPVYTKEKL